MSWNLYNKVIKKYCWLFILLGEYVVGYIVYIGNFAYKEFVNLLCLVYVWFKKSIVFLIYEVYVCGFWKFYKFFCFIKVIEIVYIR